MAKRKAHGTAIPDDLLRIDPYIVAIVGMVVLASVLPSRGQAAMVMADVTNISGS